MNTLFRFLLVSFLIWLIPFVISFPFFDSEGQLIVNFWAFKAVMVGVLIVSTFYLFRWLYRSLVLPNRHWTAFALVGLGTLAINVGLDMVTVIPFTNMTPVQYVTQVASLYLCIIAISTYTGGRRARAKEERWDPNSKPGRSASTKAKPH